MSQRWHCRIGKITPKKGIILLDAPFKQRSLGEEALEDVIAGVRQMGEWFDGNLAGVVAVVIGFDGTFSRVTRVHVDAPFGETFLPAIVSDILRRDTMSTAAHEVVAPEEDEGDDE